MSKMKEQRRRELRARHAVNAFYAPLPRILGRHTRNPISNGPFINSFLYDAEEFNSFVRVYQGKCTKRRHELFSKQYLAAAGSCFEAYMAL